MPSLLYQVAIVAHQLTDRVQFHGCKAMIACHGNRIDPVFAHLPIPLHMNMWRLMAIKAHKEKPVRPGNPAYRRHGEIIVVAVLKNNVGKKPDKAPEASLAALD